jgi:hypothetical protein
MRRARWEAAGKVVGESEEYLTGGTDVSVSGFKYGGATDVEAVQEKLAAAKLEDGEKTEEVAATA